MAKDIVLVLVGALLGVLCDRLIASVRRVMDAVRSLVRQYRGRR